jgi:hypothetical protein
MKSRADWACWLVVPAWIVVGLLGCNAMRADTSRSSAVSIADVNAVAGKWEGTIKKVPGVFPLGRVRLSISKNGSYVFSNDKLTGIRVGAGRLIIQDGRLISDESGRSSTFILHEQNGTQTLVVDGTARNGDNFHAQFMRAP